MQKLNLDRCSQLWFKHQYSNSWLSILNAIREKLHTPDGITFNGFADSDNVVKERWVGIMHCASQTIDYMLNRCDWSQCEGIWTLSKDNADALRRKVTFPVNNLLHPTATATKLFNPDAFSGNIVLVGYHHRNVDSIYKLQSPFRKNLLTGSWPRYNVKDTPDVDLIGPLTDKEYDLLLSNSIVFLPLTAASGCNTLVECIVRNTPVLVNPMAAIVEYLGEDYPMYFTSYDEAKKKQGLYLQAHEYLKTLDKQKLTYEYFVESMEQSELYQQLAK